VDMRNPYNWWTYVPGADWRHPRGPNTSIDRLGNHPVVHIAYEDAEAYCRWADKLLPTEAEWEFAARGGLEGAIYAWGDEAEPGGKIMANIWQGEFPIQNLTSARFEWTSPVCSFPPNGYGLYDMIGNVWEWTCDWYQEHSNIVQSCCSARDPRGGPREKSYDPRTPNLRIPRKVMKGGSHLCAPNYCQRYGHRHVWARRSTLQPATSDSVASGEATKENMLATRPSGREHSLPLTPVAFSSLEIFRIQFQAANGHSG